MRLFCRAAVSARRLWNWVLAEWQRQIAAGLRPDAMALKKQFNAIKYAHADWLDIDGRPWLRTIHRDARAQPFAHLGKALTSGGARATAPSGSTSASRQRPR